MSESEESDFWQEDRSSSSDQSFKEKDEKNQNLDSSSNDNDQQGTKIVKHKFDIRRNSEESREFFQDSFNFQWDASTRVTRGRSRKHKLDTASLLQKAKKFCSEAALRVESSNQNSASTFKERDGITVPEVQRVTKLRTNLLRLAKETASNFQSVPTSNEKTLGEKSVILIDDEAGQPNDNVGNAFLNEDNWHSAFYEQAFSEERMDHNRHFRPIKAFGTPDSGTRCKENDHEIGTDRYRQLNKRGSYRSHRMPNTGINHFERPSYNSEIIEDKREHPRDPSRTFYSGSPRESRLFQGGYSHSSTVHKQISKTSFLQHDNKKAASNHIIERLPRCTEGGYSMSPKYSSFPNEGAMQVTFAQRNDKGSPSQNASKMPFRYSTYVTSHDNTTSLQYNVFPYKSQFPQCSNNDRMSPRTINDAQKIYTQLGTLANNVFDVNSKDDDLTTLQRCKTHFESYSTEVKLPATSTNRYQEAYDHRHRSANMMYEANNGDASYRHSSSQSGHSNSAFWQRCFAAKESCSYSQNRGYDTVLKEQSKSDLPNVCHKEDFDANCFWKHVKFNNINPHGRNQNTRETFYVSSTEPVITVVSTRESRSFPHHHIHDPLYKNPYQVGRKPVLCQLPEKICDLSDGFDFTVLSYNVLSDDLLWQNKSLYHGCPEWVLGWQYRKKNLLKEIINYNADVLCLQEVQAAHYYNWFLPQLHEHGYVGTYKQRTGDKPDGCATFYRRDRFTQRQFRYIEYKMYGNSIMDRDNVGLITALDPIVDDVKSNKPTIFIANTHLLFNKSRGDIKLLQLARLLAEIDEMAKVGSNLSGDTTAEDAYNPVIVCGDFNSMPHSSLYNLITEGKLQYQGKSRVHISGQHSEHKHASEDTYFQNRLIPNDMNISHLCRKKVPRTDFSKDVHETEDSSSDSDDDCVIVCEKIGGKKVMMEEPGVLKHLLQLQSAYKHSSENGKQAVTTCHGTVDYIMFSQGVEKCISETLCDDGDLVVKIPRKQLYLTELLTLLGKDELHAMNKLPNTYLSSDHLALLASFRLFE